MKIRIYKTQDLKIKSDCMTTFSCDTVIHDKIKNVKSFFGIIIIDNEIIDFYYSPMGNDGNIEKFSSLAQLKLIKTLIPLFVYNENQKF